MQDERREADEINLGEGEDGRELIHDRLVVQQMYDSHVARADRRDNTLVDLDVQPLCVDVVRFDEVVVVHLAHDGVVL